MQEKKHIILSDEEEKIGKAIVDAAYIVHKELGPGLLEKVYEEIIDNTDLTNEALTFHKQVIQSRQNLLFMPTGKIIEIMKNNYAPLIQDSFKIVEDFHHRVKLIEKKHTQNGQLALTKYFYKIDLEGDDHDFISTIDPSGELIYLNRGKINDYENIMTIFHQDTQQDFSYQKKGKHK